MLALNFVYVVGNGRAVKIESRRHRKRGSHRSIPPSAPLVSYYVGATNGDGGAIERGAPSLLSAFRLRGEWFAAAPEAAIAAVETAARTLGVPLMRSVTAAERSGRQGDSLSILAALP
jgi:hypothetical protein